MKILIFVKAHESVSKSGEKWKGMMVFCFRIFRETSRTARFGRSYGPAAGMPACDYGWGLGLAGSLLLSQRGERRRKKDFDFFATIWNGAAMGIKFN